MSRSAKIGKLLLAGAVVAAALAAPVAASASDTCGANRVCLYGNNSFKWKIGQRAPGGGLVGMSSGTTNEMDSWRNGTGTNAAGYDHNGSGDCQTFAAYSNDDNVAPWNSDEVSSWRTNHAC